MCDMLVNGTSIGKMQTQALPSTSVGRASRGNITVPFDNIMITVANDEAFSLFVEELFLTVSTHLEMKGT